MREARRGGFIDRYRNQDEESSRMTATQMFACEIEAFRDDIKAGWLNVLCYSDFLHAVLVILESS